MLLTPVANFVDTGGKVLPVTPAVPVANLPLVSLILVVHLVNISVNKIKEMTLMLFSGAWGKMIPEKNRSNKSRDTLPLNAGFL